MANQNCPIGTQTNVTPTGTDAPTSLGYPPYISQHGGWEIVNPSGTVIAYQARYNSGNTTDNTQGWTNQSSFATSTSGSTPIYTGFPLTPPVGTPIASGYEIKAFNPNGPNASAFFNVVAANPVATYTTKKARVMIF